MTSIATFLEKVPPEAWVGLAGVLLGSLLTTLGVWLTNRANARQIRMRLVHEECLRKQRVEKERLEELYILVCYWLHGLFARSLHLTYVMKDQFDYNQYLDSISSLDDSKSDFSRMEMIIDIYGSSVRAFYELVIESRSAVNRIEAQYKKAYLQGESGLEFLEPLTAAQLELEERGGDLKTEIAGIARNA